MVRMKGIINFKDKKGVSLMLSYVLLISIAIVMSIAIFSWLKLIANVEPIESCEDGTSIVIEDYSCFNETLQLKIKNNGRFSVNGFIITVSDDPDRTPVIPIKPIGGSDVNVNPGYYTFIEGLKPGKSINSSFSNSGIEFESITNVRLQPFIISKSDDKIVCDEFILKQKLVDCKIN